MLEPRSCYRANRQNKARSGRANVLKVGRWTNCVLMSGSRLVEHVEKPVECVGGRPTFELAHECCPHRQIIAIARPALADLRRFVESRYLGEISVISYREARSQRGHDLHQFFRGHDALWIRPSGGAHDILGLPVDLRRLRMLIVTAYAARGYRDIRKHGRMPSDVGGKEEFRFTR